MELVVLHLLAATSVGFPDGLFHRRGDLVCIHYHQAVHVPGRATCRACAQETFLVGVEYGDKRDGRDVEAFPEKVHAHQHVKQAVLEIFDDFHPLGRINIGVNVAHPYAYAPEIFVELLRTLGQGRDKYSLVFVRALAYLFHQVVHLMLSLAHLDRRVQQARRTHHLLDYQTA